MSTIHLYTCQKNKFKRWRCWKGRLGQFEPILNVLGFQVCLAQANTLETGIVTVSVCMRGSWSLQGWPVAILLTLWGVILPHLRKRIDTASSSQMACSGTQSNRTDTLASHDGWPYSESDFSLLSLHLINNLCFFYVFLNSWKHSYPILASLLVELCVFHFLLQVCLYILRF